MFKKMLIICMAAASLFLISSAYAHDEEVHWWYHPDQYQVDFEEWYPEHKEVWSGYYKTHRDHYVSFCEKHRGWTFCE